MYSIVYNHMDIHPHCKYITTLCNCIRVIHIVVHPHSVRSSIAACTEHDREYRTIPHPSIFRNCSAVSFQLLLLPGLGLSLSLYSVYFPLNLLLGPHENISFDYTHQQQKCIPHKLWHIVQYIIKAYSAPFKFTSIFIAVQYNFERYYSLCIVYMFVLVCPSLSNLCLVLKVQATFNKHSTPSLRLSDPKSICPLMTDRFLSARPDFSMPCRAKFFFSLYLPLP